MACCLKFRIAFQRIVQGWEKYQAELHGQYSVERLQELSEYSERTNLRHVIWVLLLTSLPCLMLIVLADSQLPLRDPDDCLAHSYMLWVWLESISLFSTMLIVFQFKQYIRDFQIPMSHIVAIGVFTAASTGAVTCALYKAVAFPFPFTFTFISMGPVFSTVIFIGIMISSCRLFIRNCDARRQFFNAAIILSLQFALAVIYPACNAGLIRLQGTEQTTFALTFPVIKLIAKNAMACLSNEMEELKPELVVLNVEIFLALFVAYCIQSSATIHTTVVIARPIFFTHRYR